MSVSLNCIAQSKTTDVLYRQDFSEIELGRLPAEFLVLDGNFSVRDDEGDRLLTLAGEPIQQFGALFGPAKQEGILISARLRSTANKRRKPRFGVGLNGKRGYQLRITASTGIIEIAKNQKSIVSQPFAWISGEWHRFKLQVKKINEQTWRVQGKVWLASLNEPEEWQITYEEHETPPRGKPAIWGTPYAGTNIDFDELMIQSIPATTDPSP